jgi:hypothetical protein
MRSIHDQSASTLFSTRPVAARLLLAPVLALVLATGVATTAAAFPEQPGGNVAKGCAAVIAHTATGLANASPTAAAITLALLADACAGG